MPFIWQPLGVCILVSPLQLLGSQHASHSTLEKLGIQAINLTSETATDDTFKDIAKGKYQLVVASPEYIDEDPRFRKYLWDVPSFWNWVTRIIFDEAHCVLEWGNFRPAYRRLNFLCHLLPGATFLALSATLSPDMVQDLQRALNLYNLVVLRRSNDRPDVCLIARPLNHSLASLHDLAALIPLNRTPESPPIPKFMVFMRTKKGCERAAKFLRDRLPPEEHDRVVWVHAEMTGGFNENAMAKLRSGELYGIVCTDVAGMGIDIPDVEVSVQYQLPEEYPTVCQRGGRVARAKDKKGKSLVLFEPRFSRGKKQSSSKKRELEDQETAAAQEAKRRRRVDGTSETQVSKPTNPKQTTTSTAQKSKLKAKKRSRKCADDLDQVVDQFINAHLHPDAPKCRRKPGNQFFANPAIPKGDLDYCCPRCCPPPPPLTECCDVCNSELTNFLYNKMDKPKRPPRQPAPTALNEDDSCDWSDVDHGLEEVLYAWRDDLAEAKWGPYHPVGGLGIIDDEQIERIVRLARRQLIPTMEDFQRELKWLYMPEHGTEVLAIVHRSHPPSLPASEPVEPTPTSISVPPATQAKSRAAPQCSACGQSGHTSTYLVLLYSI
ncbi:hypothetical protein FRC07_006080 [Ceratobasidium sp. 392]|nr:hypothetical protein FRC07_006080 [Ceratobasidium sp. 392]